MPHYAKHITSFVLLDANVTIGQNSYYFVTINFKQPPSGPPIPSVDELFTQTAYSFIQNMMINPPPLNLHHGDSTVLYMKKERYIITKVSLYSPAKMIVTAVIIVAILIAVLTYLIFGAN